MRDYYCRMVAMLEYEGSNKEQVQVTRKDFDMRDFYCRLEAGFYYEGGEL
jgi:hypothetical protein